MRLPLAAALPVALLVTGLVFAGTPADAARHGCPDTGARPGQASDAVLARATVCLLNHTRERRGLRRLRLNRRLSRAALAHTRDMVEGRYFAHVSHSGEDVVDRLRSTGYLQRAGRWMVGENLAWGTGHLSTPRNTVIGWMRSPGHRSNILSERFREIGVGIVFHAPTSNAPVAATYTTTFGDRHAAR